MVVTTGRARALIAASLAAGLVLRIWDGLSSSFWLDELHSLVHASPPTISGVLEHTHWDFHAPLFFVFLHFVRSATPPETLRFIPILSSLFIAAPLLVFARRSRLGPMASPLAIALFAFLPFQVQYATELRPYAWLMLASATACHAAFSDAGSRFARFVAFGAAVAFGMLTHYLMAMTVLLIGVVRLAFLLPPLRRMRVASQGPMLGLGWLILAGAIGVAAFLPWLFNQMDWVVHKPQELIPPDAAERTITASNRIDALQAPLKSLFPQIRGLGSPWAGLALSGAALFLGALGVAAASWLWRALKRDTPPADRSVVLACSFAMVAVVLVVATSIWGWARVSVRYLCIAAWLWPIVACELLAAVRGPRARVALAGALVIGALLAGIGHAGGTTRENVRGAVAEARAIGAEMMRRDATRPPIYTALLSQPHRFEHCTPYLAYGRDLGALEPKDLPGRGTPGFDRPLIVITRRWYDLDRPGSHDRATTERYPIERIRAHRVMAEKRRVDDTMTVWVFTPEAP